MRHRFAVHDLGRAMIADIGNVVLTAGIGASGDLDRDVLEHRVTGDPRGAFKKLPELNASPLDA